MKRFIFLGLSCLLVHLSLQAQINTKLYQINIDTSQYYIETDTSGLSLIVGPGFYLGQSDLPSIKYFQKKILIPFGKKIQSCSLLYNNMHIWKRNISLKPNSLEIPIDTNELTNNEVFESYPRSIYPDKNIYYNSVYIMGIF